MQHVIHRPSAPLAGTERSLWLSSDAPAHPRERSVPSGTLETPADAEAKNNNEGEVS